MQSHLSIAHSLFSSPVAPPVGAARHPWDLSRKFDWASPEGLEAFVSKVGPVISHWPQPGAMFLCSEDRICLPPPAHFPSPLGYYGVLFHELVHWSGHPARTSRLARICRAFPGEAQARAVEETVAEAGSAMLLSDLGLSAEGPSLWSQAYCQHWSAGMPIEFRDWACFEASCAVDFLKEKGL